MAFDYDRPQSVGRVRAFYGNFGMFVRALAYIQANGPDGLRQTTEDAVLNANYIRKGLEGTYDLPYSTPTMHEVVFSDKLQAKKGVRTMDIAKRLIDYGFHPYTTAFPLIVPGALMIEPTESESKEEMDLFVEAMKSIAEEVEEDPQTVLDAPHSTRVSRLDETAAARKPVLRWKPHASLVEGVSDQLSHSAPRDFCVSFSRVPLCPPVPSVVKSSIASHKENLRQRLSRLSLFASAEKRNPIVCLLLAVVTLALYNPVNRHPFVNYDDDRYVTENPHVRQGFTDGHLHLGADFDGAGELASADLDVSCTRLLALPPESRGSSFHQRVAACGECGLCCSCF